MSFFSVLCCGVSFKRERKKEPKEEEETKESSRSSYIYIFIYNARGNESRCMYCARACRYILLLRKRRMMK